MQTKKGIKKKENRYSLNNNKKGEQLFALRAQRIDAGMDGERQILPKKINTFNVQPTPKNEHLTFFNN